jgi:inorganic pyrophosphatase
MLVRHLLLALLAVAAVGCRSESHPQQTTVTAYPAPSDAVFRKLSADFTAARAYPQHVWRDTRPLNDDGTANGYVEISRGESTKWEFRIPLNKRDVDRMIPETLGGYPTNYGFLPRTVSYDGDPADVLVLGPAIAGGELVRGRIVGLMKMTDTGDLDSKVVISPLDAEQRPSYALDDETRARLTAFFNVYKRHEGKPTEVTGWGSADEARQFLEATAAFFSRGTQ